MKKTTLFSLGGLIAALAASAAGAQQAAVPTPPRTVHPLPQSTTDCRGCSDQTDTRVTPAVKYDERKDGTVKPAVRPDAKPVATTKAKKHRKPVAHPKKKVVHPAAGKSQVSAKADSLRK